MTYRRVKRLKRQGIAPTLLEILVGNDPASQMYLKLKHRRADRLGINSIVKSLPGSISRQQLLDLLTRANQNSRVNGIVVQSPLPVKFDEGRIDRLIDPRKDADGVNPLNLGRLWSDDQGFYPVGCTPKGIMTIFRFKRIPLAGRRVVIIGRSRIVGRPLAGLLTNAGALVTILNHTAVPLRKYTKRADVVITATGKINLLTATDVKRGATVIDVGENPTPDGRLVGDADFSSVAQRAGQITPVPGGVGPVTVATLMRQVVELTQWSLDRNGQR